MKKLNKKKKDFSLGNELRRVQCIPLDRLSVQLGIEPETAKLIQYLIRNFLSTQEEETENPDRPIFFHKPGCACKWCRREGKHRRRKKERPVRRRPLVSHLGIRVSGVLPGRRLDKRRQEKSDYDTGSGQLKKEDSGLRNLTYFSRPFPTRFKKDKMRRREKKSVPTGRLPLLKFLVA